MRVRMFFFINEGFILIRIKYCREKCFYWPNTRKHSSYNIGLETLIVELLKTFQENAKSRKKSF